MNREVLQVVIREETPGLMTFGIKTIYFTVLRVITKLLGPTVIVLLLLLSIFFLNFSQAGFIITHATTNLSILHPTCQIILVTFLQQ